MFRDWYNKLGYCWDTPREVQAAIYEAGFKAGMAVSRNYTANTYIMPDQVQFSNGRIVKIVSNKTPGVHLGTFLEITLNENDPRSFSDLHKGAVQLMETK